jgi:NADPH-dependent 2,4-dienoyl-CoA reductase/sulfur reductase-like enzyme
VKDQKKLVVRTPQQFKEKQDIEVKTEHRVTKIDPKEKKIEVVNLPKSEAQWFSYDQLIIATGARSRRLDIPGSNASNIFTLKDRNGSPSWVPGISPWRCVKLFG